MKAKNQNCQKALVKGFDPIYDKDNKDSEVLILGTAPGAESLKKGEYYADPGNRFWEMIEAVYGSNGPPLKSATYQTKIDYLLKNKIALWDILACCDREGSADEKICKSGPNIGFNDIEGLVKKTKIKKIICAGWTAYDLFQEYLKDHPLPGVTVEYAPSTSSANNGHYAGDKLIKEWEKVVL